MLVSERWLTNADQTLRELTAPTTEKQSRGLFYALRPFQQTSNWSQVDGVWRTDAQPLKNETYVPLSTPMVEVCDPIAPSTVAPTTKNGDRFWAVLRGRRWQFVAGDDGKRFETAQAVTNVTAYVPVVGVRETETLFYAAYSTYLRAVETARDGDLAGFGVPDQSGNHIVPMALRMGYSSFNSRVRTSGTSLLRVPLTISKKTFQKRATEEHDE